MIDRILAQRIRQSLEQFPAVGLIGARQVGKTTLARAFARDFPARTLYLDMELPSDYAALNEPEQFLPRHTDKLVIIDEIQRRGELFPVLRSLIDADRRPGRFLLLGSSSPDLKRQSGESLAGRIAYHELSGLLLSELPSSLTAARDALWLRGGLPDSFLAPTDETSVHWRENFIQTYLQRDLAVMGYAVRTPAVTLRRFWQMLAHCHGQNTNTRQMASGLDLSWQTIRRYLDMLEETFMVRQLPPFHANLKKRLVKTPKVYLRDAGVMHCLLGIDTFDALLGHPILGASWEGFCLEQILSRMPSRWDASFYRTQAGAGIDLVLTPQPGRPPIVVEFKYSQAPKLTKGFWNARADLHAQASFVVYPGQRAYPMRQNVEALPLTQIDRIWDRP